MSISPAQMILHVASAESPAPAGRSAPASAPAPARAAEPPAESPAAAPVDSSLPQFSTMVRIDDRHRFYYEFVNIRTGDVVYEFPPEMIRKLAESLEASADGESMGHRVDVKS